MFDFSASAEIAYSVLLLKFYHVYASADLRLHFEIPFTATHVETGYRNTIRHMKVARYS